MPFPFTFSLSAPGLSNPFSAPPLHPQKYKVGPSNADYPVESLNLMANSNPNAKRRYASPSPTPSIHENSRNNLKRGWEPSFAEPSQSVPTLASSNGYLDTPAKYREIAEQQKSLGGFRHNKEDGFEEISRLQIAADEQERQQPPAKRRRGLAGSIVSTAVSAALIGTAVGLTVYRLWRDRGKDIQQPLITVESAPSSPTLPPPPPYTSSDSQQDTPTLKVVPATPRSARKSRNHPASSHSARRRTRRINHQTLHNIASFGPGPSGSGSSTFPPTQPAFDFSSPPRRSPTLSRAQSVEQTVDADEDPVDDQMDWIGSKLSSLIEEGRKALGKQVVVMSEAKEDEVDDGSGEWIEEDEGEFGRGRSTRSRSGSTSRRRGPAAAGSLGRRAGAGLSINPPAYGVGYSSASLSASPRRSQFSGSGLPSSLPINIINGSSLTPYESTESWESPEVRESMERARARAKERRAQQTQGLGTSFS